MGVVGVKGGWRGEGKGVRIGGKGVEGADGWGCEEMLMTGVQALVTACVVKGGEALARSESEPEPDTPETDEVPLRHE